MMDETNTVLSLKSAHCAVAERCSDNAAISKERAPLCLPSPSLPLRAKAVTALYYHVLPLNCL